MSIIGHPIGDIDERIIISEMYAPDDFKEGWYFYNRNVYQFVSTDFDPFVEEIVQNGTLISVTGFNPIIIVNASGVASQAPYHDFRKEIFFPSGTSPALVRIGRYWDLFADINNPYLFVPYFNDSVYGEIMYIEIDKPLPRFTVSLPIKEQVLSGILLKFKEQIIEDHTKGLLLKEKIIASLSADLGIVNTNRLKLMWNGDRVHMVEILRRGFGESTYSSPIATVPWSPQEYEFNLDNESYTFTVRGALGTGTCVNEVSVGLKGQTELLGTIDLGDFVKYFEIDIPFVDVFMVDIGF